MSETRHTPGPWAVGTTHFKMDRGGHEIDVDQVGIFATSQDFETDQIAGPPCICMMFGSGPAWREGAPDANAYLIAAAPDLLEALRDSWQLIAELEDAINENLQLLPPDTERIAKTCEKNRAAIAKATGDAA